MEYVNVGLLWNGSLLICTFVCLVHLVQFHDASWTICLGAAVDAAEAEAATRARCHESTTLRMKEGGNLCNRKLHKSWHVGLQDYPT